MSPKLPRAILRDADISVDEFRKLLEGPLGWSKRD